MDRETIYRSLTIATPLVAFLCVSGVTVYEWQRLKRLEAESSATEAAIAAIDRDLRSYEAQPPSAKFPTVEKTAHEQAQFLDSLRANADYCKVQLVRWSNVAPPPPPSNAPTDKPASGLPTGVSEIDSNIEVVGQAENTRRFLYNIVRSHRLLNMSEIRWVRENWPGTHFTCKLARYVAPPVTLPNGSPATTNRNVIQQLTAASQSGNTATPGSIPNPMDAPGVAHRNYREQTESNVSKLSEVDPSQSSASPRTPAGTNAQR